MRQSSNSSDLNRLKVAEQRAQALIQLNRRDEAKKVVSEALAANGPWFPEDAAKLKQLRSESPEGRGATRAGADPAQPARRGEESRERGARGERAVVSGGCGKAQTAPI